MHDSSANTSEAAPVASVPTTAAAPSPPASTPNNDDTTVAAAAGTAPQVQPSITTATSTAPIPAAVVPVAPSGMPPPTAQAAATTPTGAAPQAQQTCVQDPISGYLLQDPAFVAAVKRQDPALASQAAAKSIKLNWHSIMARFKPHQSAAVACAPQLTTTPGVQYGLTGASAVGCLMPGPPMAGAYPGAVPGAMPPGMGIGERRISDPDGRFKRGGSCEPVDLTGPGGAAGRVRELRRGDWVVIRSANKSTDPELLGHEAWVARVEHNGWVELQVPKLGRTVKLQQRYLQLLPLQHPMLLGSSVGPPPPTPLGTPAVGPPTAAAGAAPPPLGLPPPGRRTTSDAGGGMGPPGIAYMDEQGRPYKRPQVDSSIRPALLLEALPPARVASTPGRNGSSRVKETVRAIRRELLSLEEAVPWHYVHPAWKNTRPGWRRSLQRNVDVPPLPSPASAAPPPLAAAAAAADAAAAAAMAALVGTTAASMLELHDALMTDKTQGLFARRGAWEARLRELAEGGNNHVCLQVLWTEMAEGIKIWLAAGAVPPGTPGGGGGGATSAAGPGMPPYSRSYDGAASERGGDAYMGQPMSEDDYYMAAAAAHQHHQTMQHLHQPSPFFDYTAATVGGGGRSSARPAITPWMMRSELSLLLQSVDGEIDTDLDEGPDVTDVEDELGENDSDVDPVAAARRQRRRSRRRGQSCPVQLSERDEQQQQQPAPPADAEMQDAALEGEQHGGEEGRAAMGQEPTDDPSTEAAAMAAATEGQDERPVGDDDGSVVEAKATAAGLEEFAGTRTAAAEPMEVDSGAAEATAAATPPLPPSPSPGAEHQTDQGPVVAEAPGAGSEVPPS